MSWMSVLEPTPVIMVMFLAAMIGLVVADRVLVMVKGKEVQEAEQPSVNADELPAAAE